MKKIKYEDIPLEFRLKHYNKCVEECDLQTPIFCYCGKIASGFYTQCCKKFLDNVRKRLVNLYLKETGV